MMLDSRAATLRAHRSLLCLNRISKDVHNIHNIHNIHLLASAARVVGLQRHCARRSGSLNQPLADGADLTAAQDSIADVVPTAVTGIAASPPPHLDLPFQSRLGCASPGVAILGLGASVSNLTSYAFANSSDTDFGLPFGAKTKCPEFGIRLTASTVRRSGAHPGGTTRWKSRKSTPPSVDRNNYSCAMPAAQLPRR